MLHPLMLHEHPAAFWERLFESFERSGFSLERNEGPTPFVAGA